MTPEQQNIAIAEICGYTAIMVSPGFAEPRKFPRGTPPGKDARTHGSEELPNYTGDLNAMHEAEKVLTQEQKIKRVSELCKIIDREYGNGEIEPSDVCSPIELTSLFLDATAAQRAEAFLKALGKWKL